MEPYTKDVEKPAFEKQVAEAVRQLREQEFARGHPFLISNMDLPTGCFVIFPSQ